MAVSQITSVKLVLLGESAVGKSSIVLRYVQNTFKEFNETTIGAAFMTQTLILGEPSRTIKFEIWDTAGQERYHSLAPMYFRGAHAAVIVYDIQNKESFIRAKSWVTEVTSTNKGTTIIALAGNKADKADARQVTTEEAKAYAEENNLIFMESSAKSNLNIAELFYAVALKLPVQTTGTERTAGSTTLRTEGSGDPSSKMCCK